MALTGCVAAAPATDSGSDGDLTLSLGRLGVGSDAVIALGEEQGIYEQYGLTIDDTVVANPPAGLAAVQSGQLDVGYTTVMSYLMARSQGVDIQAVASGDGIGIFPEGTEDLAPYDLAGLFVNPDSGFTNEAQLEGKTVAVLARNSTHELGISAAVEREGGDPSTINWVSLDFASAIEALKSGSIDAAGLVSPFTNAALDDGLVQLGAPTAELFGSGAVTTLWVSTPATIAKKGDAINAFVQAQHDAATYANEHLEEALAVSKEITGVGLDIDQMTLTYWVPTLNPDELESQMELMVKFGLLDEPLDMTDIAYTLPAS